MKRLKSYDEDSDEDAGKPSPAARDWSRRDQDSDRWHRRTPSSSFSYMKRSSDRSSFDEDREISRPPPRKRFDYETMEGIDRRKGFDRYRESSSSPSQRGLYSGDRMYRSESFSGFRREFPKGFRSERDRLRREGSSGSSWWKSSGLREVGGVSGAFCELKKSPSVESDLVGRRSRDSSSFEDRRGRIRVRDSPTGESMKSDSQSVKSETQSMKSETVGKECREGDDRVSGSGSEMEEGELEPDQEPVSEQDTGPLLEEPQSEPAVESSSDVQMKVERREELRSESLRNSDSVKDSDLEKKEALLVGNKLGVVESNGRDGRDDTMGVVDVKTDAVAVDKVGNVTQLDSKDEEERQGEVLEECQGKVLGVIYSVSDIEGKLCMEKPEISQKEISTVHQSNRNELIGLDEQEQRAEGEQVENVLSNSYFHEKNIDGCQMDDKLSVNGKLETEVTELTVLNVDVRKQGVINLEVGPRGSSCLPSSSENVVDMDGCCQQTLTLMEDKLKEEDKVMSSKESCGGDEGLNRRGLALLFQSEIGQSATGQHDRVSIDKIKQKSKMESLDLSLSLPGGFADNPQNSANVMPDSPGRGSSIQSMPSLFPTDSDGFTMSVSLTSSQPFLHNASCSLNQNSMDNFEHSVGSRPIFQRVDQVSSSVIWQSQASNESKRKAATPLLQRVLLDGNTSCSSHNNLNQNHPKPNGLLRTLSRKSSPTQSIGSRHSSKLEPSKDKRLLVRERSSNSLFKSEEQGEIVLNGVGVTEKIVLKIVTEPLYLSSRMLLDMTDNSIAYLKQTICEMLVDRDKIRKVEDLQEVLKNRSDLAMETLLQCPNVLLQILVALKTAIPGFIKSGNIVSSSELCEIFLGLKCRNLACQSMLPVDDCDCKVCSRKDGFCSACMCLVCHKFDNASNTCSWVGCDVCLHWCHTDCGLHHSYIKSGQRASGGHEMSEMQFHCVACNHRSEMFGFVKEVFRTCAKDWKSETLFKELQYVKRIFSDSNDLRGKKLHDIAGQMLLKLENKVNRLEVVSYLMEFLSGDGTNIGNHSSFPAKEQSPNVAVLTQGILSSSRDASWCQPIPTQKAFLHENVGMLSGMGSEHGSQKALHSEVQANIKRKVPTNVEAKPIVDELETVVKFKQAEAKLYQERADDARREAEGLKRIATAKVVKIDEDYATRIIKLQITEAEEKRRQKLEEVRAIERANSEYFNMKMRMEADIKDLLIKMEATRRNFNT